MSRFLLLAFSVLTFMSISKAQSSNSGLPPLIDRSIFFDDPEISGAKLSPDGKWMTFMKPYSATPGEEGERNVWIKSIGEAFEAARPLTANDRPIPGYFWSHDSKYIMYVQDAGGDENYHVYAIDPSTSSGNSASAKTGDLPVPRALTSGENVRAQITSVPRSKPGVIFVGLNDRDPQFHDLYEVSIADGSRKLIYQNDDNLSSYTFDHAGKLRVATKSNEAGGTEIYAFGADQKLTKIYECTVDESCYPTGFDAKNERVYFVSNHGDIDKTQLLLLDLTSGETELVEQDPEGEVDFGGAITSDVTHELLGTVYDGDKRRIYWRDKTWEADYTFLEGKFPGTEISTGSSTADERKMLVYANSDTDPGATYLFDRDTREVEFLYRPRPELPTESLANMTPVRYPSSDGLEIPAYLTLPKGVDAKRLPLVMLIHGGPWARDNWGYNSFAQFLANRGYAVLQPNFRSSTGFGKAYLNAGNGEWGKLMQDDITAGVDYLVSEGIVDKRRVGIMGGSYGGYATLAGVAFTPDVYAAGVSIVGPSNLITLLESIPPYWASFRKQMFIRMADPETEEGRKWLAERSPLNSADKITAPLLIAQGANDPRVKQAESDQIVVAMRDLKLPVEYLVAPDEGHGFRRPENNIAMIAAIEKFFAAHLGGRYQPDMPDNIAKRLGEITVDPATVVLAEALSAEELKGERPEPIYPLVPGTRKYAATMAMGPQTMTMDVVEEVTEADGFYTVKTTMNGSGMSSTDEILLSKEGLVPQRRTSSQGPAVIELGYEKGEVMGTLSMGGNNIPVEAKFDGELFSDGPAEGLTFAAIALEVGMKQILWRFDVATQKMGAYKAVVSSKESVTVPAGTADAFVVEIVSADGKPGKTTYFIEAGGDRRVLKVVMVMPAMGGATMTQELAE
ncbi:MAG: alpha/beta fold hydrolase [Saprospiraceae bacterium]